jgi:hypothetical protein
MAVADQMSLVGTSFGDSKPEQDGLEEPNTDSLNLDEYVHNKPEEPTGPSTTTTTDTTKDDHNAIPLDPEAQAQAEIDDEDIEYPHGLKLGVVLAALCLAVFLVALDQTIISTAIPRITDHFNSIQDIGWYGSAYLLTATALQPTFGRIYTIFSVSLPLFLCSPSIGTTPSQCSG